MSETLSRWWAGIQKVLNYPVEMGKSQITLNGILKLLVLLVLVLPLFTPLRGLLHGRRYTIAWSCFLAVCYFTHGVVESYSSPVTRHLGLLEVTLTSLWFLAALAYIRLGK